MRSAVEDSPWLDVAEVTFRLLTTGPQPLSIDRAQIGHGLPVRRCLPRFGGIQLADERVEVVPVVHRPRGNGSFRNRMSGATRLKTATSPA